MRILTPTGVFPAQDSRGGCQDQWNRRKVNQGRRWAHPFKVILSGFDFCVSERGGFFNPFLTCGWHLWFEFAVPLASGMYNVHRVTVPSIYRVWSGQELYLLGLAICRNGISVFDAVVVSSSELTEGRGLVFTFFHHLLLQWSRKWQQKSSRRNNQSVSIHWSSAVWQEIC